MKRPQTTHSLARSRFVLALCTLSFGLLALPVAISAGELEGIKINGDWTVTIANPEGEVLRVHKFENALTNYGARVLADLLGGGAQVQAPQDGEDWGIAFNTGDTTVKDGDCLVAGGLIGFIPTSKDAADVTVVGSGGDSEVQLSRTFSFPSECLTGMSYSIEEVATLVSIRAELPGGGSRGSQGSFTRKQLVGEDEVTGILADQLVTLNVKLTFN